MLIHSLPLHHLAVYLKRNLRQPKFTRTQKSKRSLRKKKRNLEKSLSTMVRFRYFIKQQLPPVRREVVKTWLYKLGRLWMSSANLTLTNSSVGTRRANLDMYQPATSTQMMRSMMTLEMTASMTTTEDLIPSSSYLLVQLTISGHDCLLYCWCWVYLLYRHM